MQSLPPEPPPPAPFVDDDAAYGAPVVVASTVIQLFDNIMYVVVFVFGVLQQSELDKSAHYMALLAALVLCVLLFQAAQERLRALASDASYRKHAFGLVLSKLLMLAISYLTGLLARTLSSGFTNGPQHGHFDLLALALPIVLVVLIVVRMYHFQMSSAHRPDIATALARAT
jgi:hypothetical protein